MKLEIPGGIVPDVSSSISSWIAELNIAFSENDINSITIALNGVDCEDAQVKYIATVICTLKVVLKVLYGVIYLL